MPEQKTEEGNTTATATLTPDQLKKFKNDFPGSCLSNHSKVSYDSEKDKYRVTISVLSTDGDIWEENLRSSLDSGFLHKKGWSEIFTIAII